MHQVRTISIPFTTNGVDLTAFQAALAENPRLYITNSGVHNPTGANLNLSTAYQVLKLAEQHHLMIVEPYVRYAGLNGLNNVLQIGSFSKTLSASVRCGYIIANAEWTERLIDLKIASSFNNDHLNALIIQQILSNPAYKKHLDWLRTKLAQAMSHCVQELAKLHIKPWLLPKSGMFLWCQVPERVDTAELSKLCLQQGVILAPGRAFSQAEKAGRFLRFNVAQSLDKRVFQVLENAIKQHF